MWRARCFPADADGQLRAVHRSDRGGSVTIDTSPFVRDDADRMLGRQFLRAVVNWSLAVALNLDPDRPLMQLLPDPETRLGFNNPDNLYYVARVSDTGA